MNKNNKYLYGTRIKQADYMHTLFGYAMPNRCDNEAFFTTHLDLTKAHKLVIRLNAQYPEEKFTIFQLLVAAVCKLTIQMPKINRFYKGHKYFQRKIVTVAFTVKNKFDINSKETIATIKADSDDTLITIHKQIIKQIEECRKDSKTDKSDASFNLLKSIPQWLLHILAKIIITMDKKAKVPDALFDGNPFYCTWFLSNLGSIGLDAAYHHLSNYGTNSCFCTMGKIQTNIYKDNHQNTIERLGVNIGITIDERIADGYYYKKSLELLQTIISNPSCLLDDLSTPIKI